jgi:hypothetical protein
MLLFLNAKIFIVHQGVDAKLLHFVKFTKMRLQCSLSFLLKFIILILSMIFLQLVDVARQKGF